MHKFYTGERKDQWMEPAIRLLNEVERLNIVVYYSSMQVIAGEFRATERGRPRPLPRVCARCHGDQARGGERFPRLAGQQNTYLITLADALPRPHRQPHGTGDAGHDRRPQGRGHQGGGRLPLQPALARSFRANIASAAATVAAMSASLCAAETKPASKADGAR